MSPGFNVPAAHKVLCAVIYFSIPVHFLSGVCCSTYLRICGRGAKLRKEVAEMAVTMCTNNTQVDSSCDTCAELLGIVRAYLKHGLPRRITLIYRLIPDRVRWLWSMGSQEGSAGALAEIEAGGSWAAFRKYNYGWRILPGYIVRRMMGFSPGRFDWKLDP